MTDDGASFVRRVARTLEQRRLVGRGEPIVVACSGGPDSVALLDALHALTGDWRFALEVVSVDHGLRPGAADEVRFVRDLAASLDVPFTPVRLGLSPDATPAVARDARYAALRSVAGSRVLAVGHTRTDQAETVLARILRGGGLASLVAIKPVREDGVVRPLLDVSRVQVLDHLARRGLRYVSDPTNRDEAYQRPRIRHGLLPALAAESPEIEAHLAALADEAARAFDSVAEQAASEARRAVDEGSLTEARLALLAPIARSETVARFLAALGARPSRSLRRAVEDALVRGGNLRIAPGIELSGAAGVLRVVRAREPGPERET